MKDKNVAWAWVGLVVVVIFAIIAFAWKPGAKPVAPSPAPVYAPQGQLVPQFPEQLILGGSNSVANSYSIGYSTTTNQYTAVFNTSTSMVAVYSSYKQYFLANQYTIINDIDKYADSRGLYVTNASSEVSVAIVENGTSSVVTVMYTTK